MWPPILWLVVFMVNQCKQPINRSSCLLRSDVPSEFVGVCVLLTASRVVWQCEASLSLGAENGLVWFVAGLARLIPEIGDKLANV